MSSNTEGNNLEQILILEMVSNEPSLGNVRDLPAGTTTQVQEQVLTPLIYTYGWINVESYNIPYIIVDDIYVSVRILNDKVLSRVKGFSFEVYNLFYLQCSIMSKVEVDLFNMINIAHGESFGSSFLEGCEYKMQLFEFFRMYYFLKFCEYILYNPIKQMHKELSKKICGFLQITAKYHVPFIVRDNESYTPLFYFEGDFSFLGDKIIVCTNWEMAYFKLLFKLQKLKIEFGKYDLCQMVKVDDLLPFVEGVVDTKLTWPLSDMRWMKPDNN
ncbi:hypothetical protein GWI33_009373 [Rhynchophorus ferrugineus]|uniref:Uncharacterized protein n=1 Tax=Rhynchophorus ferrugineus TaxID=354439 RepID=A0A834MNL9_RHYFE|nr:hypothetical protein GWI33_009373 [Rhynchophorus ferrugineus]